MGDDRLTLVLNGDVFDFDAPRVVNGESLAHDHPRDSEHAASALVAILRDHPEFVRGLGEIVAAGHKVVFVSGNHDAQLTLPEVRDVLRNAIEEAAGCGAKAPGAVPRIEFYSWFYRTPEGILFEHGHQYDSFCNFRYPMAPFGRKKGLIQPTLGSLTARLYMGRLGFFNPHVDATFMLSAAGYLQHWFRYYLFTKRFQSWIWLYGAFRSLYSLMAHKEPASREKKKRDLALAKAETGASLRAVSRHFRLFSPLGEDRLWTCIRELWLDRAFLTAALVVLLGCWALSKEHAFGFIATLAPVAMTVIELSNPKNTLNDNWKKVDRRARQVATAHNAKAVVFGHTHNAGGHWEDGVFYGNTGSWSAAFRDVECTQPLHEERPLIWLTVRRGGDGAAAERDGMGEVSVSRQSEGNVNEAPTEVDVFGGLCTWHQGKFVRPLRS